MTLLIVALARPRKGTVLSEISTEGVAIEVVADRSGSMQAEMDYFGQKLNRFEVVKKVLSDFISGDKKGLTGRSSDLVGLVTFARYADTTCPLVLSHNGRRYCHWRCDCFSSGPIEEGRRRDPATQSPAYPGW